MLVHNTQLTSVSDSAYTRTTSSVPDGLKCKSTIATSCQHIKMQSIRFQLVRSPSKECHICWQDSSTYQIEPDGDVFEHIDRPSGQATNIDKISVRLICR